MGQIQIRLTGRTDARKGGSRGDGHLLPTIRLRVGARGGESDADVSFDSESSRERRRRKRRERERGENKICQAGIEGAAHMLCPILFPPPPQVAALTGWRLSVCDKVVLCAQDKEPMEVSWRRQSRAHGLHL